MEKEGPVNLSTSRVISDTLYVSAAKIAMTVLKPIRSIVLGRLLGPELYGILLIPVPYVQIFTLLSNIGFNTAVVRLIPGYRHEGRPDLARMIYRSTTLLTLILSMVWSILMLAFSGWIARDLAHRPDAVNPIRIYALIIPFIALNAFFAVAFLAMQRGRLRAALSIPYGLLNLLLPIFAVLWNENVTFVLGGFLAAEAIGAVLFAVFFHRRVLVDMAGKAASLVRGMKEVFGFGFLFFFASLGWNLINSVDRIMVKYYLPAEELAFYGMAALVITALSVISSTAGTALIPSLTAAKSSGDTALFRKQVWNTSRIGLFSMIPAAAVLYVHARDIYEILLPGYTASAPVLQILVAIGFIDILCRVSWATLVAHGSGGRAASAYITAAVINLVLNRIMIPRYGIEGAAIATLASFVALTALLQMMMGTVARVRIPAISIVHPALLSLVYPALGYAAAPAGRYPRLLVVVLAGTAVYLLLAVLTGLIRGEDLDKGRSALEGRERTRTVGILLAVISFLGRFRRD